MARGRGGRGQRSQQPARSQQEVVETDPGDGNQRRVVAVPRTDPPTTPVRRVPFRVPEYNPPPIVNRPGSPSEEEFDFTEADETPISGPPAIGAMSSPVKRARVTKEKQDSLHKKSDLEVWNEKDEDIIGAQTPL